MGYVACLKKMWNSFKSWVGALYGRANLEELVINERIILNWICGKFGVNVIHVG
jgi:hypothetical protein